MDNKKYLFEIDGRLQILNGLRKKIVEFGIEIIGNTLYKEDLFFSFALDRSSTLFDDILNMLKKEFSLFRHFIQVSQFLL